MAIEITMPPGEYYVCDPCYALSQTNIEEWFSQMGWSLIAHDSIDGYECLAFRTLEGDGVYPGSDGLGYAVDSGCIGLVPVPLAEGLIINLRSPKTFDQPFLCRRDGESGQLVFDDLVIETGQ